MDYDLKLELIINGIKLTDLLKEHLIKKYGKFYNDDYVTTTGIMLEIGDSNDLYVTAHFNNNSNYTIDYQNEQIIFLKNDKLITSHIKIWTPPEYMVHPPLLNGVRATNIVNSHFDRARINPISGCSFTCSFCDLNQIPYKVNNIEIMEKGIELAIQDDKITHILISGGTPKTADLSYLTEVYTYFPKRFPNYPIDVMMTPRGFDSLLDTTQYKAYLQMLKDAGVDGLSINIELYNEELLNKYCIEKNEIGTERYLLFLKYAVEIFGTEKVCSGLIVGLEPLDDTIKAVEEICKVGAMPMLSPYVPYGKIGKRPTLDDLQYVLEKTKKILTKYNIPIAPLCKKCKHNTL